MVQTYAEEFRERAVVFVKQLPRATPYYLRSLVPFSYWVRRYNRTWFYGDLIAGITVGVMLVPQSLAYAKVALLPLQYGLYTGLMGTLVYTFLGTSKDIAVGPTAVISMFTGQVATKIAAETDYEMPEIAIAMAFILGIIIMGVGLLKLGIIMDLVSAPVIMGFTSGAALRILVGQVDIYTFGFI
ncbi:Sulfate permease 2, partial [Dimargaris xerosporica]